MRQQSKVGFWRKFFLRVAVASVAASVFLSITLLLSLMPQVVAGPVGFKEEYVSALIRVLCKAVPTSWFPLASAPFVWWCVFRSSQHARFRALTACTCILGALITFGMLVVYNILKLHAVWALTPPEPHPLTTLFNFSMLGFIVFLILIEEISIWRDSKQSSLWPDSERDRSTPEP